MLSLRLDETPRLPSFRRKWAALLPEDRVLIRLAFAALQRRPLSAKHHSRRLRLRRWLVEIHTVLIDFVRFIFCEVIGTELTIVIDAVVLPPPTPLRHRRRLGGAAAFG